nr:MULTISPECIES: MFS transporter [unclassified Fusibacter]
MILLLFGRVVSDIGSSIQMLILPLYIIDIGGSAATIGLSTFLSLMPIMLAYPFAGVMGDRLNRKYIMVGADSLSAIFVLVLARQSYFGHMNLIMLLTVQGFVALFYGFFDPATKGMIPQLVESDMLARTNAKVATLRIMSGMIAPLVAMALYTRYGITLLFLINGISFLVSALSESMIKYKHVGKKSIAGLKGVFLDLKDGIMFIRNAVLIKRLSIFFLMVFALIHPVISVVLPLFFRTELNYTDTVYGYLQVVLIFGALVGSIGAGFSSKDNNMKKTFLAGVAVMSLALIGFAVMLLPTIVGRLGNDSFIYLIGFGFTLFMMYTAIMFVSIPLQTIIQKQTTPEYMSRVFSIVGVISKGGMPLGALIYGAVLDKVSIHTTAMIASVIVLLLSLEFLNKIRQMEEF